MNKKKRKKLYLELNISGDFVLLRVVVMSVTFLTQTLLLYHASLLIPVDKAILESL